MNDQDRRELFSQWCRLLISYLTAAGDVLLTLRGVADDWNCPGEVLPEPHWIDISTPHSGICKMIRKAISLGVITEADIEQHISKDLSIPLNWKEE